MGRERRQRMQQPARAARGPFVLSLLSAIGLAIAVIGEYWTFTKPYLSFFFGADAVLAVLAVLIGSFLLALFGLI
jgi:hypothetical protein